MPKIVIENGPERGRSYEIRTEGAFFCGRDSTAQVQISDEMASRRHFQIDFRDGRFRLRDLESKNGVLLNGRPVSGVSDLSANDRIQVGDTLLTFVGDDPHPLIGRELSGYRIEDRIGRGGMGTVYRALQLSLDRTVALKILAPHLVENQNFINLFIREARAAGALSHPNIVQVYDVGVEESVYFYSMEYIPHGSVEDLLNREGRIPLPRTLEIIRDAALGLQYAELKGLVHRDIKPGNLMVGSESVIKIGDLGIARFGEEAGRVSQKDGVSGSPHFIAPEQARGLDIDHRSDLYALGISFYQMLCGQTPYRGATPREVILCHLREAPPPLIDRAPDLPAPVVELVASMMEKDRDVRIPSATAILERLEPLLRRYRDGAETRRTVPRRRAAFVAGGLGLVLTVAIFGTIAYLHFEKSLQQERDRNDHFSQVLARAEIDRDFGRLERVTAALDELDGEIALPSELELRRTELGRWVESRRADEETAARARLVREAFDAVRAQVRELAPEQAIAAWDAFLADHASSPLAEEAQGARDRIATDLATTASREQKAQLLFLPLQYKARTLAESGDFRGAVEQLALQRLGEEYAGTPADRARVEEIGRVQDAARSAWARAGREINADLDLGQFTHAQLALAQFRGLEFLAGEVAALAEEIDRREREAREGGRPTVTTDPVGIALAEAWERWARADEDGEGARGTSLFDAVENILDFELQSLLETEERAALDRHVALLRRLPEFLDELGRQVPSTRPPVDLIIDDGVGTPIPIDLEGFDRRWVRGKRTGTTRGIQKKWWELTPACRIAVMRAASIPHAEYPLVGLFATANGDLDLAELFWSKAEPSARPLIDDLRAFAARAKKSE